MIVNILSNNFSGETTNITFSSSTGGTQVITGATIPYEFSTQWGYGNYSIQIPTYSKSCPLSVPEPTFTASILPTGTTQYENVILTGSTDLTNPVYNWTLTNFFDVSGNSVSSYVGNPLIEGYFSSTGGSVSMTAVGEDDYGNTFSATTTDFVVSEFVPTSVSGIQYWWDTTDSSTITFRTGTNYIEQIDDKSGNAHHLIQPTATNQPLYSASTLGSVSAATFDGIDNYLYVDNGVETNPTGTTTLSLFISDGDKSSLGLSCNYTGSINQECSTTFYWMTSASGWNSYDSRRIHRTLQLSNVVGNVAGLYSAQEGFTDRAYFTGINWSGTPNIFNIALNDENSNSTFLLNNLAQYTTESRTSDFIHQYTTIGTASHTKNTDYWFNLLGEFVEMIHFDTSVSQSDLDKLQRYMSYKHFGTMNII